jgi:nucleotide-binding universal stress UspA family protein
MSTIGPTTIVVGLDGSSSSVSAARFALAEGERRGWAVVGLAVLTDSLGLGREDMLDDEKANALRSHVSGALVDASVVLDEIMVAPGHPAATLCDIAAPAGLLVLGARGLGGFSALLLGSTTAACVAEARCPLVVIPAAASIDEPAKGRIVVGIDGSAGALDALRFAVTTASTRTTTVVEAMSVWRTPHLWEPIQGGPEHYERIALDHLHEALAAIGETDVPLTSTSRRGHVTEQLLEASTGADLLMIANDRRQGGRLDRTATPVALVSHAACPVVILP